MKCSIIKGFVLSVSVALVSSVMAPSVDAATSPIVTWKVTTLKPSTGYATSTIASTNSTGAKIWSVSGSCILKSGKVTTKASGSCTVKLVLKAQGKYSAKTASKKLTIASGTLSSVATVAVASTTTVAPRIVAVASTTTVAPGPTMTIGQSNAKKSAASYLKYDSFSRQGLINQLLYEKFTLEDATFGVDIANTDWNVQAGKTAASYLKYDSFSRQGLINQLLYEKFTQAQAEYGVAVVGY